MAETNKIPRVNIDYSASECFKRLTQYEITAHWYHLTTTSYEEHKALDFLKDKLTDIKDTVLEVLLGYISREPKCEIKLNLVYSSKASSIQLCKELWDFANEYENTYSKLGYGDLEQLFQTIKEYASKTKYLLTLN